MDLTARLAQSANAMRWEADSRAVPAGRPPCGVGPFRARNGRESSITDAKGRELPIYEAAGPGGRRFPLLKAMLTTACERDCLYCAFRAGRNMRRASFKPEEMARAFDDLQRKGIVQGLFLSTGIFAGGANSQNKLLHTAKILRRRLGFRGYLHLKIMPGVERGQVERAMQLANRVSINLEAPNPSRLEQLAPNKDFDGELLAPLQWMESFRAQTPPGGRRLASSATQFVVGAAGESDLELLATTERLYRRAGLSRTYFSAFDPLPDTPLENLPAESPRREHRLYQASYLLRDYGFDLEDMPFDASGRLPLDRDPKSALAEEALGPRPVEVNLATPEELRRVPGIGPRSIEKIIRARRVTRLRDLRQLDALGVSSRRAAPYVLLDGRRPDYQTRMFSDSGSVSRQKSLGVR
ncbi:MAG TPA: radical SAM protein [Anaerolineales bacterium]|nr:radical SAM protein [Anaerolineales bacterium]